jgi:hypothetical protein
MALSLMLAMQLYCLCATCCSAKAEFYRRNEFPAGLFCCAVNKYSQRDVARLFFRQAHRVRETAIDISNFAGYAAG